jgi:hypothetical protein
MAGQHLAQLQLGDLTVQGGDQPDLAGHEHRARRLHLPGLTQRRRPQHRLDPGGVVLDAAAVGTPSMRVRLFVSRRFPRAAAPGISSAEVVVVEEVHEQDSYVGHRSASVASMRIHAWRSRPSPRQTHQEGP